MYALLPFINIDESFNSYGDLVKALRNNRLDAIVMDVYVAAYRKDLLAGDWYRVSKIIKHSFTYGLLLAGDAVKLQHHFRDYVSSINMKPLASIRKSEMEPNKVMLFFFCLK